jgi:hypothetical protein
MVYFQAKSPNWGMLWRALEWKMLVKFVPIRHILRSFVNFVDFFIFCHFGILCQEKSGNPVGRHKRQEPSASHIGQFSETQ